MCRKTKITADLEVSGISKNGTPALKGMEKAKTSICKDQSEPIQPVGLAAPAPEKWV